MCGVQPWKKCYVTVTICGMSCKYDCVTATICDLSLVKYIIVISARYDMSSLEYLMGNGCKQFLMSN